MTPANGDDSITRHTDRAQAVVEFIERLTIPSGPNQGKPFKLIDFEREFIRDVYEPHRNGKRVVRRAILSLARKNGKAVMWNTPIPTPHGFVPIGQLRIGDQVFDERGQPCRVTHVSPTYVGHRCWRLRFADGSEIVADDDHQWLTRHSYRPWVAPATYSSGKPRGSSRHRSKRPIDGAVTTSQIANSLHLIRPDGVREHNHKLPVAGALQTPKVDLAVPPYVLAYWLGNGSAIQSEVTTGAVDAAAIAAELERELGFIGRSTMRVSEYGTGAKISLSRGRAGPRLERVQAKLQALGVLGDKHIPPSYLWASRDQRLALLQGLMDSDGNVGKNGGKYPRCYFDNTNERIARSALQLVRSLGFKATIEEGVAKLNGRVMGPVWTVGFMAYREDNVFRLQRKNSLLPPRPPTRTRSQSNAIVACDEVSSVPTVCIEVDSPSKLYLAGEGFTPTHNSSLIAAMGLAHLVGPEAVLNGEIYSAANDRDQASIIYKLARQFVEIEPELREVIEIVQSTKTMIGRPTGSVYRAISAEAGTKHGYMPSMIIFDELAQAKSRDLYDVLDTSFGGRDEPLFVIISTQSNDPEHVLSKLIDDGLGGADPTIVCHLYAADEGCELDDEAQWKKANPALGLYRDHGDLATAIAKAIRMPAEEPKVRNLFLNQRVAPVSSLIARAEWMACAGEVSFADGEEVYLGLDLSSTNDLTALAMISMDQPVRAQVFCWKPAATLRDHSNRDFGSGNRRYEEWVSQGWLLTTPGRAIDPEVIAEFVGDLHNRYLVRGLAYDAWRIDGLLRQLDRIGLAAYKHGDNGSGLRIVPWGQGYRDMGPAIDALEVAIMERKLVHGNNPCINWQIANSVALTDSAGNRKLDKERAVFRIDAAVALAMALGLRSRDRNSPELIDISALIG